MDVKIVYDAINAIAIDPNDEVKTIIQEGLGYVVAGSQYMNISGWAGTTSMFNWTNNSFPSGFVRLIANRLRMNGHKPILIRKPLLEPLGKPNPKVNNFPENPDYGYQNETVERLVKMGGMIAQIATGGGKSVIACKALARINRLTLFVTTRSILMYQMKENFDKSLQYRAENGEPHLQGKECGVIGDGLLQVSNIVNVATVQSLSSFLDEPDPKMAQDKKQYHLKRRELIKKLLSKTSLIILEEAHEIGSDTFYDVARQCRNADYRLGLTATPFMKNDAEDNMRLIAVTGEIGIRVTEKYLIDRGILAKPYFLYRKTFFNLDKNNIDNELKKKYTNFRLGITANYQRAYTLGVVYNDARNKQILNDALSCVKNHLSCVVLVKHKKHGQKLEQLFAQNGIVTQFIYGESNHKERAKGLADLASGKIQVLIGSTILDVGVDVPSIGAMIMAGGDKAEVAVRQRVGRGLRAKKVGPNICFVFDYLDFFNKHLMDHSINRKVIIDQTDGFKENILPINSQLPIELLR